MVYTAKELASLLNGIIIGDNEVIANGPSKIEEAKVGTITFLSNNKYETHVYTSKASIILVDKNFELLEDIKPTLIKVENVYESLGVVLDLFDSNQNVEVEISQSAIIHASAVIGDNTHVGDLTIIKSGVIIGQECIIHDQVFIGKNVVIGKGVILYPGVKIYHNVTIGDNCIIHSNAVLGSDGFGYSRKEEGGYKKISQIGQVKIGNDVEIGSCTVIDRATMGDTIIEDGAKLDNLIQIAHNVVIGKNTAIAAQAGISGSTKVGANCMIGGQVGIAGHITIAENTLIQAQSGVAGDVKEKNSKLYGYPAIDYQRYLRAFAYFKKLPEIVESLRELDSKVDKLTNDEIG